MNGIYFTIIYSNGHPSKIKHIIKNKKVIITGNFNETSIGSESHK